MLRLQGGVARLEGRQFPCGSLLLVLALLHGGKRAFQSRNRLCKPFLRLF